MPDPAPRDPGLHSPAALLGFALRMLVCYGIFHALYFWIPIELLHDEIYPRLFGQPAVAMIGALQPDEAVSAHANRLGSPRAALEIVRGCDGSGVLFLVCAAVLSFPASWRARLAGVLLGAVLVYGLNLLRLTGLYFVAAYRPPWFLPLHTYFVPTLLIVAMALYYLAWLGWATPARPR